MFELYQTQFGSRGSMSEVWIDKEKKLVKKFYKPDGKTIKGGLPYHTSMEDITKLFNTEVYWTTKLKSKFILNTHEYGSIKNGEGYYILQEYLGPDLLHFYDPVNRLSTHIPDAALQIEEMFAFFQEHNIYKMNNAMCNLINDNGKIKAFDFKYTEKRSTELQPFELRSIDCWLSKIDPCLTTSLRKYV